MGEEQRGHMVISSSPVLKENRRALFPGQWNFRYTVIEENNQMVLLSDYHPFHLLIKFFSFFLEICLPPHLLRPLQWYQERHLGGGSMIQAKAESLGI